MEASLVSQYSYKPEKRFIKKIYKRAKELNGSFCLSIELKEASYVNS